MVQLAFDMRNTFLLAGRMGVTVEKEGIYCLLPTGS